MSPVHSHESLAATAKIGVGLLAVGVLGLCAGDVDAVVAVGVLPCVSVTTTFIVLDDAGIVQ